MQYQAAAGLDGAQLEQQHVSDDVVGGQGRGVHVVQVIRYGKHVLGGHGHELGPRAPLGQGHDAIADLCRIKYTRLLLRLLYNKNTNLNVQSDKQRIRVGSTKT